MLIPSGHMNRCYLIFINDKLPEELWRQAGPYLAILLITLIVKKQKKH